MKIVALAPGSFEFLRSLSPVCTAACVLTENLYSVSISLWKADIQKARIERSFLSMCQATFPVTVLPLLSFVLNQREPSVSLLSG